MPESMHKLVKSYFTNSSKRDGLYAREILYQDSGRKIDQNTTRRLKEIDGGNMVAEQVSNSTPEGGTIYDGGTRTITTRLTDDGMGLIYNTEGRVCMYFSWDTQMWAPGKRTADGRKVCVNDLPYLFPSVTMEDVNEQLRAYFSRPPNTTDNHYNRTRQIYDECKKSSNNINSPSTGAAYEYQLSLEEKFLYKPLEVDQWADGFILHASNGGTRYKTHADKSNWGCSLRQFDYLEIAWQGEADEVGILEGKREDVVNKECARIMGIIRLSKKINPEFLRRNGLKKEDKRIREYESIVLLNAWLKDVPANEIQRRYISDSIHIGYKQYNYDKTTVFRGRRKYHMWLDITSIQSIIQPVCGYHDPDFLPTYDSEPVMTRAARFNIVTLAMTRKCVSNYRRLIGDGEHIYGIDNQIENNMEDS